MIVFVDYNKSLKTQFQCQHKLYYNLIFILKLLRCLQVVFKKVIQDNISYKYIQVIKKLLLYKIRISTLHQKYDRYYYKTFLLILIIKIYL